MGALVGVSGVVVSGSGVESARRAPSRRAPDGSERAARNALLACLLAGFATLFDAAAIAYATPSVSASLGGGTAGVQALLASFSLTFGVGLVPAGRLGDAYGRRALFVLGLGVFLLGGVVTVLAPGIEVLIGARLLQGLGAGVISAQVLGAIQDLFRGPARLRALGLYTGVGALAALLGPIGAALALSVLDPSLAWRVVLLLPLPFAVLAVRLGITGMPRAPGTGQVGHGAPRAAARRRPALDLPGIGLQCVMILLLMAPVLRSGDDGPSVPVPLVLGAAVVCGLLLAIWELVYQRRGKLPLFARDLVRSRGFVMGNVTAMLWFASGISVTSVLTVHALQTAGASPLTVALLFAPGAAARLLTSVMSGRIHGALGSRAVPIGLVLQTLTLVSLAVTTPLVGTREQLLPAALALVGLGVSGGIVEPPLRVVTLGFAPPGLHGVAASFLQLTQRLAATWFVALTTGILLGTTGVADGPGLSLAVWTCAGAASIATIASLDRSLRGSAGPDGPASGTAGPRIAGPTIARPTT